MTFYKAFIYSLLGFFLFAYLIGDASAAPCSTLEATAQSMADIANENGLPPNGSCTTGFTVALCDTGDGAAFWAVVGCGNSGYKTSCTSGGTFAYASAVCEPDSPPCSTDDPPLNGYNWSSTSVANPVCSGGCEYQPTNVSLCLTSNQTCFGDLAPTGNSCSGGEEPSANGPPSTAPPAGGGAAGGGPAPSAGGGSSSDPTDNGGSDIAQFCSDNPTAMICQSSAVGGSCETFVCTGDPIQCQIAADLEAIRCQNIAGVADPGNITDENLAKLDGTGLDDVLTAIEEGPADPGFWTVADFLPSFVPDGSCADYSFDMAGHTFTLPLSNIGSFFPAILQWVVNVLTAFTIGYVVLGKPKAV